MKKIFFILLSAFFFANTFAKTPQTISYQAVIRDNLGQLLNNSSVDVEISILQGSENGAVVYSETRTEKTNENGLMTFAIGDDQRQSSYSLSDIDWSDGPFFLQCNVKYNQGSDYAISLTSQLMSVPYALYAERVSPNALPSKLSELENDEQFITINDLPTVEVPTKVSELDNDANYITLDDVPSVAVPTKVSELSNDAQYITLKEVPTVEVPTKVSELQNDKDYATVSQLPTVPTNVSAFTNDARYITRDSLPTKLSEFENDKKYITLSEVPTVAVPTKVSELDNDANYITRDSLPTKISAFANDKKYITIEQVPANPTKVSELDNDARYITLSDVPTRVSELTNDAKYITLNEVPVVTVPTKVSELQNDKNYATVSQLPTVPTKVSAFTNDAKYITRDSLPTKISAFTNDKKYITIEQVPANPTKVSELTNDAKYITLNEVPVVTVPTKVSELQNDKNYATVSQLPTVPTKVSAFTNDAKYITRDSLPTKISAFTNDKKYITIEQVPANPTKVSELDNDAHYITLSDVPTRVSELTNDAKYITLNEVPVVTVPTKVSELQNDKNYVTANQLPTVPTNVSAFNNDAKYLTRDSIADILSTGCSGALQNQLNELSLLVNALATRLDSISTVNQTLSQQLQNVQLNLDSVEEIASYNKPYQRASVNTYSFTTQDWNYGPDIYANVKPTDRIIYLVRHSKRGKDYSSTGGLTPNGKLWAKQVGEHYVGGIAADRTFYGSTSVTRCKETSYCIAMGRNDSSLTSIDDVFNPVSVIDGSYIVGSTSGMSNICKYYDNNASCVGTKATEVINTLCAMTVGKKFSWFTSHDYLTIPLVEWTSNKKIDFVSNKTWINFMSGVAIIVHKDKTWEVYPVRNLDDGFMDWSAANNYTDD